MQVNQSSDGLSFRASIIVRSLDLQVIVIEPDLYDAIQAAANACALELRTRGYQVTADAVIDAIRIVGED